MGGLTPNLIAVPTSSRKSQPVSQGFSGQYEWVNVPWALTIHPHPKEDEVIHPRQPPAPPQQEKVTLPGTIFFAITSLPPLPPSYKNLPCCTIPGSSLLFGGSDAARFLNHLKSIKSANLLGGIFVNTGEQDCNPISGHGATQRTVSVRAMGDSLPNPPRKMFCYFNKSFYIPILKRSIILSFSRLSPIVIYILC